MLVLNDPTLHASESDRDAFNVYGVPGESNLTSALSFAFFLNLKCIRHWGNLSIGVEQLTLMSTTKCVH